MLLNTHAQLVNSAKKAVNHFSKYGKEFCVFEST